ncbi:MAG: NAD(P)/FAD-dependent oxidoreductase [Candidatus Omnitrophota bacterium]|nr:MAG: NAD(P)/FAD-dependent oxidoreductase [Candidatus Omnitrophota bacterium]
MNYVIIGGSAAGVTACETIRKHNKKSSITLISDEKFPLYSRCLLTYLIAGTIGEDKLCFKDKNFYKENDIKTYLGKKAVSVDRKERRVSLEGGTKISYDKLLIATGATPKSVDVPGVDKKGVLTVRKIDDARAIMNMLDNVKEIAVLGGGLIGLRDAYALRQRDKKVTVIVKSPQVLSQMVDMDAARVIASVLEKNGIKIMTGVAAKEIAGDKSVESILLDNGERLACQLVIIGKGVKPNTELASSAGLKVEDGIVVNEFLQTSDKNIFAAGDVAETYDIARESGRINALWPCAVEQGGIAALNMLGKKKTYDGSLSMNSVDFFGLASISMGITKPTLQLRSGSVVSEVEPPKEEKKYEIISRTGENLYKKFVLKDNKIVGMVLVGDIKTAGIVSALIKNKIDVSSIKDILLDDDFNYAKIMPLVKKFGDKFGQEEFNDTVITY